MEMNKIIRRTGIPVADAYSRFVTDLTDALKDFGSITKEEIQASKNTDGTTKEYAHTRFYLDKSKSRYIKVINDTKNYLRLAFVCNSGVLEIDGGTNNSTFISYNIVRTAYGIMFTTLLRTSNSINSPNDGSFQSYITTFKDEYNKTINGYVFTVQDSNKTDGSDFRDWIYIATENHEAIELQRGLYQMLGSNANQTVMYNAVSYNHQLVAEHLFKKIISESGRFGKIRLDNREFISGSHFCLECKTE